MALRIFEYDKLDNCDSLDGWISAPKQIEVTAQLHLLPDMTGTTKPVPVKMDGWSSACNFAVKLEQEPNGKLYLAATARYWAAPKLFMKVGSLHTNKVDPKFVDPQCKHTVLHGKPYEKRMMVNTGWWSRRTIDKPSPAAALAFYRLACDYLNIQLPPSPLQVLRRPQGPLPSGAA